MPGPVERLHQTRRLLRTEGAAGVAERLRCRAAERLAPPASVKLPVLDEELVRAGEIAANDWALPPALPASPGEPLTVAWVLVPTGGFGSGGHTTLFRQVEALERAGHRCVLYLTERHGWSMDQHRTTLRRFWPRMRAEVRDAGEGIEDSHAIFATGWSTAYTVLASPARGVRFYLVQDFEPWFHPAGSEALLAEATYRFGFHGVTAGAWLAGMLERDYGMRADHFDFGCDLDRYSLDADAQREGVCYYARHTKPRRAFELGISALKLFADRNPDVPIHLFGDAVDGLPFPATSHGTILPEELNELYNRCVAGLVLSATNVSLVPHEMLASGCVPVVNDAEHNRVVLDNPEVLYTAPTPFEIANALSDLVGRDARTRDAGARAAASSVSSRSWNDAGRRVERIVRDRVAESSPELAGAVA